MQKRTRLFLNLILLISSAYTIYLILTVPQPYGNISLIILAATASFNIFKNKTVYLTLFIIGITADVFVLYSATTFVHYTAKQRDKFNIPTAVTFEKEPFQQVLIKAKQHNKLVFVDFYTGWCGPCLAFTQNVLTDKAVGKAMNKAFLNLKYDAEKGEGISLAKKYNVKSYPTLLILDFQGNLIQDIGESQFIPTSEEMVRLAEKYTSQ